jgi:small GTP-binding protein
MDTFKVSLIGDVRVGKTSLVSYLLTDQIPHDYVSTLGIMIHPVIHNHRRFNIWDISGRDEFDGYYILSQIGLLMYNNPNLISHFDWEESFRMICPHTPVVKCVNLSNEVDPTQFNQPHEHLFFINFTYPQSIVALMDHLCNVAL